MAPHSQHAPMQASDWGSLEETSRSPGHVAEWVPGLLDWMAINGAEGVSGKSALVKVVQQPPLKWAAAAMVSGRDKGRASEQSDSTRPNDEDQGCFRPSMGLEAVRPLQQGELIMSIPLALTMCTCRVRTPPNAAPQSCPSGPGPRPLHDRGASGASPSGVPEGCPYPSSGDPAWEEWEGLTALAAWILREQARGEESPWAPYIASLPCHVALPSFAPDDLLDTLQDAELTAKARVLRRTYEEEFAKCCSHEGGHGIAGASEAEFFRACALVSSRAFTGPHPKCSLLAPLTDLINHSQQYNAAWKITPSAFILEVTAPVAAGEELCVSYGSKCSTSLLFCYGFCPGANAFDCLPLFRDTHDLLSHFSSTFFPSDFTDEDHTLAQEVVAQVDEEVRGAVETFRLVLLGDSRPSGEDTQVRPELREGTARPLGEGTQRLRESREGTQWGPQGAGESTRGGPRGEGAAADVEWEREEGGSADIDGQNAGVGEGRAGNDGNGEGTGTHCSWDLRVSKPPREGTHGGDGEATASASRGSRTVEVDVGRSQGAGEEDLDPGTAASQRGGAAGAHSQAGKRAVTYAQMLSASMYGPQFVLSPLPEGATEQAANAGESLQGDLQGRPFLVWPQGCLDPRILASYAALWHLFVHGQEADAGELAHASIIYSWRMVAAMGVPELRPAMSETELGALRAAMGAVSSWARKRLSRFGTKCRQDLKELDALQRGQGGRRAQKIEHPPVLLPRRARVAAPSSGCADPQSDWKCTEKVASECAASFVQHRTCKKLLLHDLEHRLGSSIMS